jgi:outer membrane protein assembly factor BamB
LVYRSLRKKALGSLVVGLFLINFLAFSFTIQPVLALPATGLTQKWLKALGSLGMTYVCPLAADLNNDGKLEIVVVGGSNDGPPTTGAVTVLNGTNGNIIWQVSPANGSAYSGIGMHTPFEIADLDGDGIPEIMVACAFGLLALHGNNGSVYWRNSNVDPQENYFAVCDVDGDGHPEIFVTRGNAPYNGYDLITCLDYRGNILRQAWCWHPCWGGLTIGDPNNDGHFKLYEGDRSNI